MTTAVTFRRLTRLAVESTAPTPTRTGSGRRRLDEAVVAVTTPKSATSVFVVEHSGISGEGHSTEITAVNEAHARTQFSRTAPALGFGTHRISGVTRIDEMRYEDVMREVLHRASLMFKKGVSASDVKPKFGAMKRADREIFGGASKFATIHHDDDFILVHDPEHKGSDGEFQLFDAEGGSYRLNPKSRKFVAEETTDDEEIDESQKTWKVTTASGTATVKGANEKQALGRALSQQRVGKSFHREYRIGKKASGKVAVVTLVEDDVNESSFDRAAESGLDDVLDAIRKKAYKPGMVKLSNGSDRIVGEVARRTKKHIGLNPSKYKGIAITVDGQSIAWTNSNEDQMDEALKVSATHRRKIAFEKAKYSGEEDVLVEANMDFPNKFRDSLMIFNDDDGLYFYMEKRLIMVAKYERDSNKEYNPTKIASLKVYDREIRTEIQKICGKK